MPAPVKRCFRFVWPTSGLFKCHSQAYFAEFGEVRSVSVIRDKDTGLSKGFGFVSMQASEGAKKALLRQVPKKSTTLLQVSESEKLFLCSISPRYT